MEGKVFFKIKAKKFYDGFNFSNINSLLYFTSNTNEEGNSYLPQPEETVVMPGFPVQTLNNSHHPPPPPYSPSR